MLGGLALVLAFAGSIFSIVHTTVANAMFLFASAPFFAALLGWILLGERVRRATWIAMAAAKCNRQVFKAQALQLAITLIFNSRQQLVELQRVRQSIKQVLITLIHATIETFYRTDEVPSGNVVLIIEDAAA